jgi:hypothetical protein
MESFLIWYELFVVVCQPAHRNLRLCCSDGFIVLWNFAITRRGTNLRCPVLLDVLWDLVHLIAAQTIGIARLSISAIVFVAALSAANEQRKCKVFIIDFCQNT